MNNSEKIKVAISIGDPNGIGPEIIVKTLSRKDILNICTPVVFCTHKLWGYLAGVVNSNLAFHKIFDLKKIDPNKVNIMDIKSPDILIEFGKSNEIAGTISFNSLEYATNAVTTRDCDVLVTAPINKSNIQSDVFQFPGHTEYLEKSWGGNALMFMIHENIKVGLVTQHIPIKEVPSKITQKAIVDKIYLMQKSLIEDFGISKPKIACLSLNPHAGDKGLLGSEEIEIITPTIKKLTEEGNYVFGPYPADSFFNFDNLNKFDAVLAMYHDQGLTSFKTIAGIEGVNFSAGLKHVRTSPDHGVGYDISGKNIADETSMVEAIYKAIEIYKHRNEFLDLKKNVLKL
ncbi:4-hydroxythreonine-4-phosphate dehydrogenase PdxA [Weeksellaceae bacterium TAE3-ERU29]|nr:4-hydroxythreonine-4-phosphate dehydrogenase PdxA [Weeksellaceae bacterium TAE3-ERU29]